MAAGLRLAGERQSPLAASWLLHAKPEAPQYTHAGMLLALGLAGHLHRLSWTDLYR